MRMIDCKDRSELLSALEALQPGDCLRVERFAAVSSSAGELLSLAAKLEEAGAELVSEAEGLDTRSESGALFFSLCRALSALDDAARREKQRSGIERAREAGKYRGRKPISVDEALFDAVVQLWQDGQISARQAMSRLGLKPNTFYRRIKEREEQKMKDYKEVEHAIKSEIKEAAKQSRKELDELKKQVKAEAKEVKKAADEVKKAADEKLSVHEVERELRKDRIRAEVEHHDELKQMKKDVEAEAKELKKLLEDG